MSRASASVLEIPDFALIVLIGATGSGKSTFARRWFKPTEIVSSDHARGLVSDDENDQSVSADAFDLVREIAAKRLKHRRLAVIDATNVRAPERRLWIELARRWHALPVAIVLDPGLSVCIERNKQRPDRNFGPGVPKHMIDEIRRGLRNLQREGFRQVWTLSSVQAIDDAVVERRPLWTDRREVTGPFDIVGDVHGCADELQALIERAGYTLRWEEDGGERRAVIGSPDGRKLVFVGDLVDRGPRSPDVVRIAMAAVAAGGFVVQGNHDRKLQHWLEGRKVKIAHGLQESIDQFAKESEAFRTQAKQFLYDLRSHYWLDGGRLVAAHAGLREEMIGRGSPAVRDFALYGETSGETDEYGLPVRYDWAADYRGTAAIVYGHTPVTQAEWVNNTICVDTGCVFGGQLTALRWPERETLSVPAARTYYEPVRPIAPAPSEREAPDIAGSVLDYADVSGRRWIDTHLVKRIVVAEQNAAAALEVMSRFAMAPGWLVYLPPTMSPVETSTREGWLERPEEAFAHYRERAQTEVVLEEKHMGSRAVVAVCRDVEAAHRRFGIAGEESGAIWTRTGRAFFSDRSTTETVLEKVRAAAAAAELWDELSTDWLLLDVEIMPWSAKASSLIEGQYAPVAAASRAGLAAAYDAASRAVDCGLPLEELREKLAARRERAAKYATAWAPYAWPVASADDLRIAPFHLLASEGTVHFDRDHLWHMAIAERLVAGGAPVLVPTRWRRVELDDEEACRSAIGWWEDATASGTEGMVVKPRSFVAYGARGLLQPALKVRGREYLRIIYGPEYDAPEHLARLRQRGLNGKRGLALREFGLGHEALQRFVAGDSLRRVHECVFAVLALESEPVDPRL